MPELRYVVLHHTGIDQPHFDLMFEQPDRQTLGSLRCSDWPPTETTVFERIADHRPAYLEYEGAVSGSRGWVSRVESGTYEMSAGTDNSKFLQLSTGMRIPLRNGQ